MSSLVHSCPSLVVREGQGVAELDHSTLSRRAGPACCVVRTACRGPGAAYWAPSPRFSPGSRMLAEGLRVRAPLWSDSDIGWKSALSLRTALFPMHKSVWTSRRCERKQICPAIQMPSRIMRRLLPSWSGTGQLSNLNFAILADAGSIPVPSTNS
jgi:hypothetical protein